MATVGVVRVCLEELRRRVVVTGLGAVTPLGADLGRTWVRLLRGEGACAPITCFALDGQPVRIGCEASEFEPERWLDRRALRRTDRFAQFAVAAARMAEIDAGLEVEREPERIGASIATAQGGGRESRCLLRRCCSGADSSRPGYRLHAQYGGWVGLDRARPPRSARIALYRVRRLGDGNRGGL